MATEQIDSITFVDGSDLPVNEGNLVGSWLLGDADAGYYELLTFNEDKTYTGYDNYFTYGFDTMTYGWYAQVGAMLTLQSNGFGHKSLQLVRGRADRECPRRNDEDGAFHLLPLTAGGDSSASGW